MRNGVRTSADRGFINSTALSELLVELSVDLNHAFAAAQTDAIKARLRSQTEEAVQLGIFGAPSFITKDGELFWGNDRLERAIAWARTAR